MIFVLFNSDGFFSWVIYWWEWGVEIIDYDCIGRVNLWVYIKNSFFMQMSNSVFAV